MLLYTLSYTHIIKDNQDVKPRKSRTFEFAKCHEMSFVVKWQIKKTSGHFRIVQICFPSIMQLQYKIPAFTVSITMIIIMIQ